VPPDDTEGVSEWASRVFTDCNGIGNYNTYGHIEGDTKVGYHQFGNFPFFPFLGFDVVGAAGGLAYTHTLTCL